MVTVPGPGGGMIGAFRFNGRHTSEFNLVSRSVSRPLLPTARVKRVEVPTLSGAQDFDGVEYDLKEITMRIMYIGKDYHELRTRAREIAAWLTVPNWSWLELDDEPGFRYLAKISSETDLSHFFESGAIDCEFEVQPFAHNFEPVRSEEWAFLGGNNTRPYTLVEIVGSRYVDNRSPQGSRLDVNLRIPETLANTPINIMLGNLSESHSGGGQSRQMTYSGPSGILRIDSINMIATINNVNAFPHFTGGNLETFLRIPIPWTSEDSFMLVISGEGSWANNLPGVESFVEYTPLWY